MSKIGNDSTEAQKVRDYYKEREKTLKEQHQKELAKISQAHEDDVRGINSNNDERINRSALDTQSTIDRRDMRHQREMSKVRESYAQQKKRESLERMNNEDHLRDTYETQARDQKKNFNAQLENQQSKSRQTLENNNLDTTNTVDNYRKRNQEETEVSRQKLNRIHSAEKREQDLRHREEIQNVTQKSELNKQYKENEVSTLEKKHQFEIESLNRRHQIAMDDLKYQNQESTRDIREEHKHSVDQVQQRYSQALSKEKEQMAATRENYYSENGRVSTERDRLNQKIRNLGEDNVRDRTRLQSQNRRQVENMQHSHSQVYDKLFEERQGMVEEFNKINHDEIVIANVNADNRIIAHEESVQKKMEKESEHNNRLLTKQRDVLITENNDKKKENELHLNQLQDGYVNDRKLLSNSHKNEKQRMLDRYHQTLDNTRYDNQVERDKLREGFEKKIAEMDLKHKNDVNQLTSDHNSKITELKDRQQLQLLDIQKENKRLQAEKDRANNMRFANREATYEHRITNMEAQHAEQLARMNDNYRQNLTDLIREGQRVEKQKS